MEKKKGKKKFKEKLVRGRVNIELTHSVNLFSLMRQSIEKVGVKKLLRIMGTECFSLAMPYVTTMLKLFATNETVETAEGMMICKYDKDNWEKLVPKAMEHWKRNVIVEEETKKSLLKEV